jgi:DNA-binding protein HU-beta
MKFSVISIFFYWVSVVNAFLPSNVAFRSRVIMHSAAAAAGEKGETFKKTDFIAAVAEKTGMSKKDSEEAVKAVLEVIQEQVSAGKRVNLAGFGTFTLKKRAARKGRNPQTGEELQIAASQSPGFSAAKAWKDAVNGKV